jgi:hypothetical protein
MLGIADNPMSDHLDAKDYVDLYCALKKNPAVRMDRLIEEKNSALVDYSTSSRDGSWGISLPPRGCI